MPKIVNLLAIFSICTIVLSSASSALAESDYRLASGDSIIINVFDEPELTLEFRLSNKPTISYPFLGSIQVFDQTTNQLEQTITEGLRGDYLIEPRVSVSIVEFRPFFITGEVESPGGYPYKPGLTLRKAITLAGGFTERASRSKMYVTQKNNNANDKRKLIRLDDPVQPDDVVTIEQSFF